MMMMRVLVAVFVPLTIIATILRFLARGKKKVALGLDDFFALLALITFCALLGVSYWAESVYISAGVGTPYFSLSRLSLYLKLFWVCGILAPTPLSCAKFSIIFLYHRLFYSDKSMEKAIRITGLLSLAWWITATVAVALPCIPVKKAWEPQTWTPIPFLRQSSGHCFSYKEFYLGIEVPNCILDFWIIAMPIFQIQKLQLSLKYKISISLIFVLAGFVGLISIIRMVLVAPTAGPYNRNVALWIDLQLAFAVICCNLPTYKPLIPQKTSLQSWFSSMGSRLLSRGRESSGGGQSAGGKSVSGINVSKDGGRRSKYNNISHTDDWDGLVMSTEVVGGKGGTDVGRDYPVNAIKMTNTFDVV